MEEAKDKKRVGDLDEFGKTARRRMEEKSETRKKSTEMRAIMERR